MDCGILDNIFLLITTQKFVYTSTAVVYSDLHIVWTEICAMWKIAGKHMFCLKFHSLNYFLNSTLVKVKQDLFIRQYTVCKIICSEVQKDLRKVS